MQCELGERFRAGWRVNWDANRQLQISIRLVTCRICSSKRGLYNLTIVKNVFLPPSHPTCTLELSMDSSSMISVGHFIENESMRELIS